MEDTIDKVHQLKLGKPKTCLSPYVHKLIKEHTCSTERDPGVVNEYGLLDFGYICSKFPEEGTMDDMSYFTTCVKLLAPMMYSVADMMDGSCYDYCDYLEWTDHSEFLQELWRLMSGNNEVNELVVLQATASVLERALGDVYLLKGSLPCPSMLKDLLVSSPLRDVLGAETLQVLRVLIGPPTSLNLRNVTWHGFPAPGEIPRRCIWFIVLLVPSIGKILLYKNITTINHREPVTFPEISLISDVNILSDGDDKEVDEDGSSFIGCMIKSELVNWDTSMFWRTVRQFYNQKRYSLCSALLMYYLEQITRFVFAAVNQCEDRLLTAEATTLYTTFDEMLDCKLSDGSPNKIRHFLSDHIIEVLLDHLSYQNGPRVRDRLGHAEASWKMFPWQLVNNLLTVATAITALFIPKEIVFRNRVFEKIFLNVFKYEVQYHRISILRKRVLECCTKAVELDGVVQYLPDLSERGPSVACHVCDLHDEMCLKLQEVCARLKNSPSMVVSTENICASLSYSKCKDFMELMKVLCTGKIDTLYRESLATTSAHEGEVLSLLEHVTDEIMTVLTNITQFSLVRHKQIEEKQLRSRQRDNFKKFLTSFPQYVVVSNMCCYLVTWQVHQLTRLKQLSEDDIKLLIRFWKSCLQLCENVRTCTQFDKNKWTDGVELIKKLTDSLINVTHIL